MARVKRVKENCVELALENAVSIFIAKVKVINTIFDVIFCSTVLYFALTAVYLNETNGGLIMIAVFFQKILERRFLSVEVIFYFSESERKKNCIKLFCVALDYDAYQESIHNENVNIELKTNV